MTVISFAVSPETLSEKVTVTSNAAAATPVGPVMVTVGLVLSYVQVNCVAALLLLPKASVNLLPATSTVVAPGPEGVKVAV